jgi:hypothetical protein
MTDPRCFLNPPGKQAYGIAVLLLAVTVSGCGSSEPPPTLEQIEQLLSVSFPADARVIGGSQSQDTASLWLIVSSEPLPLPAPAETLSASRSRTAKRPRGRDFPVSALANLVAACEVSDEDLPRLTEPRGSTHHGDVGSWHFTYREAATEGGWLTAVEVHSVDNDPS